MPANENTSATEVNVVTNPLLGTIISATELVVFGMLCHVMMMISRHFIDFVIV